MKEEEESRPCSDFANEGYKCVTEDLCDENGEIRTDGGSRFSIRNNFFGSPQSNAVCPDLLAVCCKDPNFKKKPSVGGSFDTSQDCEDYENQGYRCVEDNRCDNGQIISDKLSPKFTQRQENVIGNNDGLSLKCPRGRGTCCRLPSFTQSPTPVIVRPCSEFANQGYACRPKKQCSSDATTYSTRGSVSINVNFVAKCSSPLEECCGAPTSSAPARPVTPPIPTRPAEPFR